MELLDAIRCRRSVRQYTDAPVSREMLESLLAAAVQAPTAMNSQGWAFGVIQGRRLVREYAERGRLAMLERLKAQGVTGGFRDRLAQRDFDIFYGAAAVIAIYATADDHYAAINCSLAAQNLMLAARGMNLGSCWIGMAAPLMDNPAVKQELGVPEAYRAIATIIIGYPAQEMGEMAREDPRIVYWIADDEI